MTRKPHSRKADICAVPTFMPPPVHTPAVVRQARAGRWVYVSQITSTRHTHTHTYSRACTHTHTYKQVHTSQPAPLDPCRCPSALQAAQLAQRVDELETETKALKAAAALRDSQPHDGESVRGSQPQYMTASLTTSRVMACGDPRARLSLIHGHNHRML